MVAISQGLRESLRELQTPHAAPSVRPTFLTACHCGMAEGAGSLAGEEATTYVPFTTHTSTAVPELPAEPGRHLPYQSSTL